MPSSCTATPPACLLLDGSRPRTALAAARAAHAANIPVVLDICHFSPTIISLLPYVDYAIASAQALPSMNLSDPKQACSLLHSHGAKTAAITLGQDGVLALHQDSFLHQPAFPITPLDTTGAGDVFHGAFALGLTHHLPLPSNLAFASAASALKCLKLGGRAGIPTLPTLLSFLASHNIDLHPHFEL